MPKRLVNEGSNQVIRNSNGAIQSITVSYANLASSWIDGVDMGISYVLGDPESNLGQLAFDLNGTVLLHYYTNDGLTTQDNVGQDAAASEGQGPISRYRQDASATWDYHNFSFTLSNDFFSGYTDAAAAPSNAGTDSNNHAVERSVASYLTFDLQASYEFDKVDFEKMVPGPETGLDWRGIIEGTKITVGCDNVYDFQPPFTADPEDTLGYDPAYADPTGRFIYAEITKKF